MESSPFAGWKVWEALRRIVDADVGAECFRVARSIKTASSISSAISTERSAQTDQALAKLTDALLAGSLVATGRQYNQNTDVKLIAQTVWRSARFHNVKESRVVVDRGELFDLRIFPAIESPGAASLIVDQPLATVLSRYVFNDPQVLLLQKRARALGGQPHEPGHEAGLLRAIWPISFGKADVWNSFWWDRNLGGTSPSTRATRLANSVLGRRFSRLVDLLENNEVVAEGCPAGGGIPIQIPRSFWSREFTYIEVRNGDLVIDAPPRSDDMFATLFIALMLRNSATEVAFHVKPPQRADLRSTTPEAGKAFARVETTAASRLACFRWLSDEMQKSPSVRVRKKADWWAQAKGRWPKKLARRAFDDAWADAVHQTGAHAWSSAGAPPKAKTNNQRVK